MIRLSLVALLLASAASAQSPTDVLAHNAGYETAQQLVSQDSAFSYDRFRAGFEAGLRGDSVEIAYALGLRAGLGLRADTTSRIDPDIFLGGIQAGLRGDRPIYSEGVVARAMAAYQDSLGMRQLRQQAALNPVAKAMLAQVRANGAASARFLAETGRRPGVQMTPSGVLYLVTTPGNGPSPTSSSRVEVAYTGRLADGRVFDRSPSGEPATLPVSSVVPGFSEMLRAMRVGETRTVWIPANLAYGLQGAPAPPKPDGTPGVGGIPPNSALEFELTLVQIVSAPASPFEAEPDSDDPPPPPRRHN